ncbi:MAG: hypothetical protein RL722_814 [Pseudomonadota bacterium]
MYAPARFTILCIDTCFDIVERVGNQSIRRVGKLSTIDSRFVMSDTIDLSIHYFNLSFNLRTTLRHFL